MIAVDTNILVYAHRLDTPQNEVAYSRLAALVEGEAPWAIPWSCIHEFLSVVTNARIFERPTTPDEGIEQIDTWIGSPSLVMLSETERHWAELRTVVEAGHITGRRVHDARIAAICRQHGVRELWSADRDFSRFSGFRVVNPLLG